MSQENVTAEENTSVDETPEFELFQQMAKRLG